MKKMTIKKLIFIFIVATLVFLVMSKFEYKKTTPKIIQNNNSNLEKILETPASKSNGEIVITASGDFGANRNTESVLNLIEKNSPDFHLALGDLSYSQITPESAWCDFVNKRVSIPFLLIAGNHEGDGRDGFIDKFRECLPFTLQTDLFGKYAIDYNFSFPKTNSLVKVFSIAPDIDLIDGSTPQFNEGSQNLTDLRIKIADAKKNGIPWIIVAMHKGCITTGGKDCEIGSDLPNALIKSGVDIVLMGHVHAYERTHQLSCLFEGQYKDSCVRSRGDNFKAGKGTIFITSGAGGMDLRSIKEGDVEVGYFAKFFGKQGGFYGVSKLIVTKDKIRGLFLDTEGAIRDSFTIEK